MWEPPCVKVVTHDDSDMNVLRQIASAPSAVFVRPTSNSITGARADLAPALYAVCPEILSVCAMNAW